MFSRSVFETGKLQNAVKLSRFILPSLRSYCVIQVPDDLNSETNEDHWTQNRKLHSREIDRFGSWDLRMNFPLMEEESIRRGTPIPLLTIDKVGSYTHQGRREYQEDRFNLKQIRKDIFFLAVWDGHGGEAASDYCCQNVERFLDRHLGVEEKRQASEAGGNARLNLGRVLTEVLADLNSSFERHWIQKRKSGVNLSRRKDGSSSGTTATLVLIRDNYELVVAHVGDSKAILCRDLEARSLTRDHVPSDPKECERIESSGGQVTRDAAGRSRVNHKLAMSRSLGDFDLKNYGVIAVPDITRISLKHGKDKFLVLTTDGVSDVLSNSEIVKVISQCETPVEAAERLVDQALLFSCEDNATVLIVPFGSWGKSDDEKTSVIFSLGRNMTLTSRYN